MTVQEINTLPTDEKVRLMEAIWVTNGWWITEQTIFANGSYTAR